MKHTLIYLLFATCLLPGTTYANNSEDFVALYNKGKIEEAKEKVKGYADPRLFKAQLSPLRIIASANLSKTVADAPLLNLKSNKDSLKAKNTALIALAEIQRIAKELELEVRLASFNTSKASGPIPGFIVFITKGDSIVQITTLGELSEEVNLTTQKFDSEKEITGMLKLLRSSVEKKH